MLEYLARTVRLLSVHVDGTLLQADQRIARYLLSFAPEADGTIHCTHEEIGAAVGVSLGRITTSVVSGVGFLGAGTIFMSDRKISGLTTAASLWCTACIGLAVGSGYILMAVAAGAIVLVILRLMQRFVHVNTLKRLEVQFIHRAQTLAFLNEYFMNLGVKVLDVDFHAESRPEGNLYTNLYTLSMPAKMSYVDVIGTLSEHPNIRTVRTRNL